MPQNWEPRDWSEGVAARVARVVTELRGANSAQWVSDRTHELGCRISRSVIADLENGRRRYVSVHELVMLSQALSVSPLDLLYGTNNGAEVEFLPDDRVMRLTAVQRFSGINEEVLVHYEELIASLQLAAGTLHDAAQASKESVEKMRQARRQIDGG